MDGGKGQPRAGAVKHQGPGLCVLQPGLKTPGPRRAIQTGGPGSLALESSQRWPVHSGHTLRVPLSPPGQGMPAQSLDGGCLPRAWMGDVWLLLTEQPSSLDQRFDLEFSEQTGSSSTVPGPMKPGTGEACEHRPRGPPGEQSPGREPPAQLSKAQGNL